MSRQEPTKPTTIDEWWSTIDLRAPLETDLVLEAHRELNALRREDERPLDEKRFETERTAFLTRLDGYIGALLELDCNRSISYAGRFVADLHFYAGPKERLERRGLVELRTDKGQSLVITGERLRPVTSGSAALDIAFTGKDGVPDVSTLLSPAAYSSELSKIARLLKTPVGQELLDGLSPLYCLIRERIAYRHGPEFGWDARLVSFTPHWAGEETSFSLVFAGGRTVAAHLDYVPELCELAIRTRRT